MDAAHPIAQLLPEDIFAPGPALEAAKAILRDDHAGLDQVFTQHPELDPDLRGKRGATLSLWAYAHRRLRCLRTLCDHGADMSRRLTLDDGQGTTTSTHLLNLAVLDPDDEQLTSLLLLAANPSTKDENGTPAPHAAVLANNFTRMRQLIHYGADVDGTDRTGTTVITLVARLGNFEQVYFLIQQSADFRKPDNEVALWVQETDAPDEATRAWQIKAKEKMMARGLRFPVPRPGAARYASVQAQWEQTLEGRDWRLRLNEFGSEAEVVGPTWIEAAEVAFAALQVWMQRQGIPEPPMQ